MNNVNSLESLFYLGNCFCAKRKREKERKRGVKMPKSKYLICKLHCKFILWLDSCRWHTCYLLWTLVLWSIQLRKSHSRHRPWGETYRGTKLEWWILYWNTRGSASRLRLQFRQKLLFAIPLGCNISVEVVPGYYYQFTNISHLVPFSSECFIFPSLIQRVKFKTNKN